ncbi:MAG: putative membrane protein [Zhongshania sp.]|jgi:putative membrane protein
MKGFKPAVFIRGIAMGAADIVPGVSGGTIAFITGIYDELIESLKSCNVQALRLLFQSGPIAFWKHINGVFLLSLMLGIVTSVLSLARAISYVLHHYPLPLAALFSGLILASALIVYRQIPNASRQIAWLLFGVAFALLIGDIRPAEISATPLNLFLSGALAICAMILPGISGSFILLLLGMYQPVIDAIKSADIVAMLYFVGGCGFGLILFVRLLSWLMHSHRPTLLASLTGILLGSLSIIWPWKLDANSQLLSESLAPGWQNVTPWTYSQFADSQLYLALLLAAVGIVLVGFIEWVATKYNHF